MRFRKPKLRFVLDEGVPDAVGRALESAGHKVIYCNRTIPRSSSDLYVFAFAELNNSILVAIDGDMKQIAKGHGVSGSRFKKLSLLKISCRETIAAARVDSAMTLIEHEWYVSETSDRRIFIELLGNVIRSMR